MALPRRAHTTLGIATAIVLGGGLGLLYWWWRHRPGGQPVRRFRRARAAVVAVLMLAIGVGAVWRTTIAVEHVSSCSPAGSPGAGVRGERMNAALALEEAATWPETGIGMLYAKGVNARICLSTLSDYYVAVPADVVETSATTMGDIVLSPGFADSQVRTSVASHEARHRTQWAIATAIGGPFLFPVAYAVDEFFFPGPRNHFERLAGLEAGRYTPEGIGPILGPVQIAVLCGLGALVVAALLLARHRRGLARAHAREEKMRSA